MLERWTGSIVSKMHIYQITRVELAKEMNVTKSYVSMILNGARKPEGIRQRVEAAVDALVQRKKGE